MSGTFVTILSENTQQLRVLLEQGNCQIFQTVVIDMSAHDKAGCL